MVSAYVAIIIFITLAILEPLLMLLSSKLIRRRSRETRVKKGNYESAEESAGTRTSVMGEYLYYFPMFLVFEVLIAIMLVWVISAKAVGSIANYAVLGLFVTGFIFEMLVIIMAKHARE
jgi:NADH:ubiquinone oxidoreductase subunit 3 (subunit A)